MDYGAILRRAWEITWKNKALWILGILASCGRGGNSFGGGSGGDFSGFQMDERPLGPAGREIERLLAELAADGTLWLIVAAVVAFFIVLSLVLLALGVIGQGGLIAAFHKADQGTNASLSEGFQAGLRHFWRLLGAQLLITLIGLVIAFVLAIPALGLAIFTLGFGLLCLLPAIALVALVATVYVQFVQMAIVIEGVDVIASLRRAWDVIRANLAPVLLMGLILVVGSVIVGGLIALPFLAAVIPLLTGALLGGDAATAGLGLAGICLLGYLPILIVLQGILTTYVSGTWTLSYLRLIERPGAGVQGVS